MNKIIATIVGLLVASTPALACVGDLCEGPDMHVGTLDTSFYNDGMFSYFHEGLWMNGEGFIEEIEAMGPAELMVIKNSDFGFDIDLWDKTVNADKYIEWVPYSMWSELDVGTDVWWGWQGIGGAEFFRSAWDSMVQDDIHAIAIGYTGGLSDRISVDIGYEPFYVYESIGLNQPATCEMPEIPPELTPPVCTWCD